MITLENLGELRKGLDVYCYDRYQREALGEMFDTIEALWKENAALREHNAEMRQAIEDVNDRIAKLEGVAKAADDLLHKPPEEQMREAIALHNALHDLKAVKEGK